MGAVASTVTSTSILLPFKCILKKLNQSSEGTLSPRSSIPSQSFTNSTRTYQKHGMVSRFMSEKRSALTALCVIAALLTTASAKKKYCGVAFGTGEFHSEYGTKGAEAAIKQIRAVGANYMQLSVYADLDTTKDLTLKRVTPTFVIKKTIRRLHRAGFKVFLKPVIRVGPRNAPIWRGYIQGTPQFFRRVYRPYILNMARIAQSQRVELFAAGSELVRTVNKKGEWIKTINAVRKIYKGQVTYIANHDSYFKVDFWEHVDIISLSAYFKMLDGETGYSPNMAATLRLWQARANEVRKFFLSKGLGDKRLLIAEFGAQSKGNGIAYRLPWDWIIQAPTDMFEQVKMYEGMFKAFFVKPWVDGVFLWHWELRPEAGTTAPSIQNYTPQNKPVSKVIRKYFRRSC